MTTPPDIVDMNLIRIGEELAILFGLEEDYIDFFLDQHLKIGNACYGCKCETEEFDECC